MFADFMLQWPFYIQCFLEGKLLCLSVPWRKVQSCSTSFFPARGPRGILLMNRTEVISGQISPLPFVAQCT